MVDSEYMGNEAEITAQIRHIAERLREEREKMRISQMDLSFKAGLSQNQVNYIETGKRTPNLYTILRICNALKISPAVLFDSEDTQRKEARETVIQLVSRFM
jgi:transcriptional regulator with XRE-family HTH domain